MVYDMDIIEDSMVNMINRYVDIGYLEKHTANSLISTLSELYNAIDKAHRDETLELLRRGVIK